MKLTKWLAICLAATVLAACGGGDEDETFSVAYSVSGSGPFDVTYSTPSGGTAQERVSGSFSRTLTAKSGDFLYVSGQTNSAALSATVMTAISVNGKNFKFTASSGPFVIATASGSCC